MSITLDMDIPDTRGITDNIRINTPATRIITLTHTSTQQSTLQSIQQSSTPQQQ